MFYLGRNNQQSGPYTREQLIARVEAGEVRRSDIIWTEGMAQWEPVAAAFIRLQLPLPPASANSVPRKPETGYFAALTNSGFKQDAKGRTVFFPWGVLGRGRIVPDTESEAWLRSFLQTWYLVLIVSVIVCNIAFRSLYPLLLLPLFYGWYWCAMARTAFRYPYSDTALKLGEAYANQAAAHHKGTLWLFLATSLLFCIGGTLLALVGSTGGSRVAGVLCTIWFGLCAAAFGFMLARKK